MIYVIITIALVTIDQLTKLWALNSLQNGEIEVIKNILTFNYVENTGAAWGIFSNSTTALAIFSFIVAIGIIYLMINVKKYFTTPYINYILVVALAGTIGNFIDRAFRHFVVDFIEVTFIDFPVFNFADICVVISAIVFITVILLFEEE